MKLSFSLLALVALGALTGCNQGSPGGPGATDPAVREPMIGQDNDTFNLGIPLLATVLKQGETKSVAIGIKRGKNFDEDVTLKFSDLPKGITLEPSEPLLKHSETEAKFTVQASATAALGSFTIKVLGHPTKGTDAMADLKITVDKK
ncbi:hypothetical protein [Armatimonas sp.]|uniref:hypothetical protein n=1 Tax=Armatimonas sp. TaxID=1872638 RepID=UPI0037531FB2